jgi:hypothetical protein
MSAANSKISNNESWKQLCEAALLEPDSTKLPYRILAAEDAIAKGAKELEHFKNAMEKDPIFAPAYAELAMAYFWLGNLEQGGPSAKEMAT